MTSSRSHSRDLCPCLYNFRAHTLSTTRSQGHFWNSLLNKIHGRKVVGKISSNWEKLIRFYRRGGFSMRPLASCWHFSPHPAPAPPPQCECQLMHTCTPKGAGLPIPLLREITFLIWSPLAQEGPCPPSELHRKQGAYAYKLEEEIRVLKLLAKELEL